MEACCQAATTKQKHRLQAREFAPRIARRIDCSRISSLKPERPIMLRSSRFVVVSVAASVVGFSAVAADLPAREPIAPAYAPVFTWTGFYLGGELGWIRTDPEYTTAALVLGTPFAVSSTSSKD